MEKSERAILVLQGGGALGAYHAGVFEALAATDMAPVWVAGVSIGAINAALICGNPPARRLDALRAFWDRVTSGLPFAPWTIGTTARALYGEMAAASVTVTGVPGFFRPRAPVAFSPMLPYPALGIYDTAPLRKTLLELVDFAYLNAIGPRLSVGAVDLETADLEYFDSRDITIGPEHIMASGALPPGFPPVEIGGRLFWDGGLVSNTPLQYVMENLGADPVCIFQTDLFNARDGRPANLTDVSQREKDIQYSSRTRLTTERFRRLYEIRNAADRLAGKLPEALRDDTDLAALRAIGPGAPVTLVDLIHRKQGIDGSAKDYEFTRASMHLHWAEGAADVDHILAHPDWTSRKPAEGELQIFDPGSATPKLPDP